MGVLNGLINKDIPIPLYYQLKEIVLKEITDGKINAGDYLPTENKFVEAYSISRSTVRQAMSELVNENYLFRYKSKGTVVSTPKIPQEFVNIIETYENQMKKLGFKPKTKVICFEVVTASAVVANRLNLKVDEKVIHLERLRYANEEPIVLVETFLPFEICDFLMEHDLVSESLYKILSKKYSSAVVRVERTIEAINSESRESKLLMIEKGHAIQKFQTIGYNSLGREIEYSVAKYRGDRNKFRVKATI
ncbi:MAG TPA: GntR family transcriptional regulator [Ruminiclostridium sp.]